MDLDFSDDESLNWDTNNKPGHEGKMDARGALGLLDLRWFIPATRRARWMDLVGDYGGNENFVLDGEALLQYVLDDPLLALGKPGDCSFQIAHAYFSLESVLKQIISRNPNFDIVFFEDVQHLTVLTGSDEYIVTSRCLARRMLYNHLETLEDLNVLTFESLSDLEWIEYEMAEKPMFIMTNDGGPSEDLSLADAERVLIQRVFLFKLLSRGVAVTLLKGAQFRDSKILSFVYEQRVGLALNAKIKKIVDSTRLALMSSLPAPHNTPLQLLPPHPDGGKGFILETCQNYLSSHKSSSPYSTELLHAFIYHASLLPHVPLHQRALKLEIQEQSTLEQHVLPFLSRLLSSLSKSATKYSIPLVYDGRLFVHLLHFLLSPPGKDAPISTVIGEVPATDSHAIISRLDLPSPAFSSLSASSKAPLLITHSHPEVNPTGSASRALLPFRNNVFNQSLHDILTPIENTNNLDDHGARQHLDFGAGSGTVFSDNAHWHNSSKSILPSYLGGFKDSGGNDAKKRYWKLKADQLFMSRLQAQAATLTGAQGASLNRVVIVSVKNTSAEEPAAAKSKNKPPSIAKKAIAGKQSKQPKLSSAEKIRQQIAQEKGKEKSGKADLWWKEQLTKLSKFDSAEAREDHLGTIFRSKMLEDPTLASEIRLYRLHLALQKWTDDPHRAGKNRDQHAVTALRIIKDISEDSHASTEILKKAASVLHAMGFTQFAQQLETACAGRKDEDPRSIAFKFTKVASKSDPTYYDFMKIQEDPVTWQLRHFGEFMDRSMDSAPDPRVSFKPDAWQRRVLDCIDRDESLLVVAPTSAGKTFISFYAMEQVLRGSDDGILVYICPTKALVTQVAAEVYARFSKDLNGRSCWAIHTRDYRVHDPQKCQILITVPEVLSIMLLSPDLARSWSNRMKYIILDEIHSIGEQEGGAVWEQIILIAPCPIIGLSATIGSPEIFSNWLRTVQETHGRTYNFIEHPHRYSHLRKFHYAIQNEPPAFEGLDIRKNERLCKFLHPISLLSAGPKALPSDLALESSDALTLYEAMLSSKALNATDIEALRPATFFRDVRGILVQRDIIRYEARLKEKVSDLMDIHDVHDTSSPLSKIINRLRNPSFSSLSEEDIHRVPFRNSFYANLIHFVTEMNVNEELPAIFFNFDRTACESVAERLLKDLQKAEERWRNTSPIWKKKIAAWEEWKRNAKERERQAKRSKKRPNKKGGDDDDDDDEPKSSRIPDTSGRSWESTFNPDDPSPQFSLVGRAHSADLEALEHEIFMMRRRQAAPEWIITALQRGIAVHHAGMNKQYRSLVESLFRQRYISVVIATGTLALGINAPAKTTVFCGDSPYLTALMYRQCAGRAGRRGYDLLGRVVFYGLSLDRVQRLVLSKLPSLGGNFPLTSTLTLRLLNLLQGSKQSDVAVKAIRSITSLPQITFSSGIGRDQLLHHLRFSIEYLRRSRLIDVHGNAMNLFGIAAHLFYTEPSNFALVVLLRSGVLHQLAAGSGLTKAKYDLILVLSHLFGRRRLLPSYTNRVNIEELIKTYPSMVVLPDLPDKAAVTLQAHNKEILNIFSNYAITYASNAHNEEMDTMKDRLPLSKVQLSNADDSDADCLFRQYLQQQAIPVQARSQFAATSGHGDSFSSISELANTARSGIHLHEYAIPSFEHITAKSPLNAYILDFYIHGQKTALAKANGIRSGDVWYLLQDFDLTLATLKASLEQLFLQAGVGERDQKTGGIKRNDPKPEKGAPEDWEASDDEESSSGTDDDAPAAGKAPTPSRGPASTKTGSSTGGSRQTLKPKKTKKTGNWDDDDDDDASSPTPDDTASSVGGTAVATPTSSANATAVDVNAEEMDKLLDVIDDEDGLIELDFERPVGVGDLDWRLYEVVVGAWTEFHAKFKEMWA